MANIKERDIWEEHIYQIETSDPVLGGENGIANRQATQLGARTKYLKNEVEKRALTNSPAFTGAPTAPTPEQSANNQQIATTAFVKAVVAALVGSSPVALDTLNELAAALGNDPNFSRTILNRLAQMQTALDGKAAMASPTFTGSPKAPTPAQTANDTTLATTAFVKTAIAKLVGSAPAELDTLEELAAMLAENGDLRRTLLQKIAEKAPLSHRHTMAEVEGLPDALASKVGVIRDGYAGTAQELLQHNTVFHVAHHNAEYDKIGLPDAAYKWGVGMSMSTPGGKGLLYIAHDKSQVWAKGSYGDDYNQPWKRLDGADWTEVRGRPTSINHYGFTDFDIKHLGQEDISQIIKPGLYGQPTSAHATPDKGYPTLEAGTLLVTLSAYGAQQEYTTFNTGNKYVRGRDDNSWLPWRKLLREDDLPILPDDSTNLCLDPIMLNPKFGFDWAATGYSERLGDQDVKVITGRDSFYLRRLSVNAGDRFYLSCRYRRKKGTADLGIGLHVDRGKPSADFILGKTTQQGLYTLSNSILISAGTYHESARGWSRLEGYVDIPSGVSSAEIWLNIDHPHGVDTTQYYIKDVEWRRVPGKLVSEADIIYQKIGSSEIWKYPDGTMIQAARYSNDRGFTNDYEMQHTFSWPVAFKEGTKPKVWGSQTSSVDVSDRGKNWRVSMTVNSYIKFSDAASSNTKCVFWIYNNENDGYNEEAAWDLLARGRWK